MEIILTVLITLAVISLLYTIIGVIRLNKRVNDLEEMRMEFIDLEMKVERTIENLERDMKEIHNDMAKDYKDRIEHWVASTNRRISTMTSSIKKIDKVVNPNMDILKKEKV